MEEDIVYKYTEKVIKQIVKKDDEYTRKMIKEYVKTKYPNEKVRIDFYDEETIDKIIDLGINALKNEKTVHTCLHCGKDTPLYCEKCYQELISKNAELQMRYEKINNFLHSNSFVFQNENGDIQGMLLTPENFIPKQVVRNKIEEVNKEYKKYTEKWEKLGMNKEHPFYRYIVRLEAQIDILEELLGDE